MGQGFKKMSIFKTNSKILMALWLIPFFIIFIAVIIKALFGNLGTDEKELYMFSFIIASFITFIGLIIFLFKK